MPNPISDKQLYKLCQKYGQNALKARRKFMGLLPEVFKRNIYTKKGFGSIHEFAAKLAGISQEQVNRILRLERKYADKPVLHAALIMGDVSVNKLVKIASIATTENQQELVSKAKILSSRALEIYTKEINEKNKQVNAYPEPLFDTKTVHVHSLKLNEDIKNELLEMQEKGIDVNNFLKNCLQQRKQQIQEEKEQLALKESQEKAEKSTIGIPTSRYIPAKIRNIITKEYGTKCSKTNCNQPSEQLHHEKHFFVSQLHNPHDLKPLCRGHHELAHAEDLNYKKHRKSYFH